MSASGRPPKARDDYTADAQGLLLLMRAIKSDSKRPSHWKDSVLEDLKALVGKLMDAPTNDGQLALPVESDK